MTQESENDSVDKVTHNMSISFRSGAVVGPMPVNWTKTFELREELRKFIDGSDSSPNSEFRISKGGYLVVDIRQVDSISFLDI